MGLCALQFGSTLGSRGLYFLWVLMVVAVATRDWRPVGSRFGVDAGRESGDAAQRGAVGV